MVGKTELYQPRADRSDPNIRDLYHQTSVPFLLFLLVFSDNQGQSDLFLSVHHTLKYESYDQDYSISHKYCVFSKTFLGPPHINKLYIISLIFVLLAVIVS